MSKPIDELSQDQIIDLIYYLATNCSKEQYKIAMIRIVKTGVIL